MRASSLALLGGGGGGGDTRGEFDVILRNCEMFKNVRVSEWRHANH